MRPTSSTFLAGLALSTALMFTSAAQAEGTISIYGGANYSPHSSVNYNFNQGAGNQKVTPKWDGGSFEMPPYYGVRGTWWFEDMPNWGIALDYSHSKIKADPLPPGFSKLEFTDGVNFFTANAMYRWDRFEGGLRPYAGAGIGFIMPRVEVDDGPGGAPETDEFQITGAAVQALVGLDYQINDDWSVFGELKSSYGKIDADLDGGGFVDTHVISNQIIVGVTYKLF